MLDRAQEITCARTPLKLGDELRLPVPRFQTMEQVVDDAVAQRRFQMTLILPFALAALVLAGLGIYGVVSYSVASRPSEIGIRTAVGARGADILKMILGRALRPVARGTLCRSRRCPRYRAPASRTALWCHATRQSDRFRCAFDSDSSCLSGN